MAAVGASNGVIEMASGDTFTGVANHLIKTVRFCGATTGPGLASLSNTASSGIIAHANIVEIATGDFLDAEVRVDCASSTSGGLTYTATGTDALCFVYLR